MNDVRVVPRSRVVRCCRRLAVPAAVVAAAALAAAPAAVALVPQAFAPTAAKLRADAPGSTNVCAHTTTCIPVAGTPKSVKGTWDDSPVSTWDVRCPAAYPSINVDGFAIPYVDVETRPHTSWTTTAAVADSDGQGASMAIQFNGVGGETIWPVVGCYSQA